MNTQQSIRISETEVLTRDYLLGDWFLEYDDSELRHKIVENSQVFKLLQLLALYVDHFNTQQAIKTFKVESTLEALKESEAALASIIKGNNAYLAKGKF